MPSWCISQTSCRCGGLWRSELVWGERHDHRRERERYNCGYGAQSRLSHLILAVFQVWVSRDVGVGTHERSVPLVPLSPLTESAFFTSCHDRETLTLHHENDPVREALLLVDEFTLLSFFQILRWSCSRQRFCCHRQCSGEGYKARA